MYILKATYKLKGDIGTHFVTIRSMDKDELKEIQQKAFLVIQRVFDTNTPGCIYLGTDRLRGDQIATIQINVATVAQSDNSSYDSSSRQITQ